MRRIVLALFLIVVPAAAQTEPPASPSIPQLGPAWTFSASSGTPSHPATLPAGSGWSFIFPAHDDTTIPCWSANNCKWVGYIETPHTKALTPGSSLEMTLRTEIVSGHPVFRYQTEQSNTCPPPATVRFIIEEQGNDGTEAFYRWWSNPVALRLMPEGQSTIKAEIRGGQWSSVFGQFGNASAAAAAGFRKAMANPAKVGMTFGGGCFFGHGVYTSGGTVRFTVSSYTISSDAAR